MHQEVSKLGDENKKLEQNINDLKSELDRLHAEINRLAGENKKFEENNAKLKAEVSKLLFLSTVSCRISNSPKISKCMKGAILDVKDFKEQLDFLPSFGDNAFGKFLRIYVRCFALSRVFSTRRQHLRIISRG